MDKLDILEQIFWYGIFCTPLLVTPLVWKYSNASKTGKMTQCVLISISVSLLFFMISMEICLRNGLGPS
jgi:hypothetical protein